MSTTRRPNARAQRARATRQRMRDAALRLFRDQGYAATTMQAIAEEAGVAVQTLYFTFGTKRSLLSEILDIGVAGDEEPVATLDRPRTQALLDDPDPVAQLRGQARISRQIHERLAPVLEVVRGAATADPDIAELWETNLKQRTTVAERLITALGAKAPLRVDHAAAVDITVAMQGPDLHDFLVRRRGWTPDQYEDWLAHALIRDLLGP